MVKTSFFCEIIRATLLSQYTDPLTVEDENTVDNPVISQVQGSSSETTEAQYSGGKWKRNPLETAGTASPAKYQTFEF